MGLSTQDSSSRYSEDELDTSNIMVDINVTPLVDIMLVLLIIFMVSTTLINQDAGNASNSGIQVDLPKVANKGGQQQVADLIIALTEDGRIIHQGENINKDILKQIFTQTFQKNPKTLVVVQADQEVKHGHVAEILDLARAAGLERLSIATESNE